jgi:hypothetical protein
MKTVKTTNQMENMEENNTRPNKEIGGNISTATMYNIAKIETKCVVKNNRKTSHEFPTQIAQGRTDRSRGRTTNKALIQAGLGLPTLNGEPKKPPCPGNGEQPPEVPTNQRARPQEVSQPASRRLAASHMEALNRENACLSVIK